MDIEESTPYPFDMIAAVKTKMIESEYISRTTALFSTAPKSQEVRGDVHQHTSGSFDQSRISCTRRASIRSVLDHNCEVGF